jgi:hypothetical protein
MPLELTSTQFQKAIAEFLGETFEEVHGIYLDKGTSFFETLEHVTAEEASSRAADRRASVAAHVKHAAFYLRVVQSSIRGESIGKVNWLEIWNNDRPVTQEQWRAIVEELRREYESVQGLLNDPSLWESKDAPGEFLAMVVHTAYHLGSTRYALGVIRAKES